MPHRAVKRWRLVAFFLFVVATVALFIAVLLYRAHRTDLTARRLCQVIAQIVADQDARLAGVSYYKQHPDELARAHSDNRKVLERLNCSAVPPVRPPGGHP